MTGSLAKINAICSCLIEHILGDLPAMIKRVKNVNIAAAFATSAN